MKITIETLQQKLNEEMAAQERFLEIANAELAAKNVRISLLQELINELTQEETNEQTNEQTNEPE